MFCLSKVFLAARWWASSCLLLMHRRVVVASVCIYIYTYQDIARRDATTPEVHLRMMMELHGRTSSTSKRLNTHFVCHFIVYLCNHYIEVNELGGFRVLFVSLSEQHITESGREMFACLIGVGFSWCWKRGARGVGNVEKEFIFGIGMVMACLEELCVEIQNIGVDDLWRKCLVCSFRCLV